MQQMKTSVKRRVASARLAKPPAQAPVALAASDPDFLASLRPKRLAEVLRRLPESSEPDEAVRRQRFPLVGLRGAGKTTLGRARAKAARTRLVARDRQIEPEPGTSFSEVFLLYGPGGYRR